MTPPTRSAREPSSPLAEVCEALEKLVRTLSHEHGPNATAVSELRAALATLRRARVVRWLVTYNGVPWVYEERPKVPLGDGWTVTPLIAFEEPER